MRHFRNIDEEIYERVLRFLNIKYGLSGVDMFSVRRFRRITNHKLCDTLEMAVLI